MEYGENLVKIVNCFETIIDYFTDDIGRELTNVAMPLNTTEEFLLQVQDAVHRLNDARIAIEELYHD